MTKINVASEMQGYFNDNIGNLQDVLNDPKRSLMDKFDAEIRISAFKHAQQRLTHLQYEVSKEG